MKSFAEMSRGGVEISLARDEFRSMIWQVFLISCDVNCSLELKLFKLFPSHNLEFHGIAARSAISCCNIINSQPLSSRLDMKQHVRSIDNNK